MSIVWEDPPRKKVRYDHDAIKKHPGRWAKYGPYTYWPSTQQSLFKKQGFECVARKLETGIYLFVRWPKKVEAL